MASLTRKKKTVKGAPQYSVVRSANRTYAIVNAAGQPTTLRGYKTRPLADAALQRVLKGTLKAPLDKPKSKAKVKVATLKPVANTLKFRKLGRIGRGWKLVKPDYAATAVPIESEAMFSELPNGDLLMSPKVQWLYHGTDASNIPSLRKSFNTQGLYLVADPTGAAMYAEGEMDPVILRVSTRKLKAANLIGEGGGDTVMYTGPVPRGAIELFATGPETASMEPIVLELAADNHKPPAAVAKAARRGLELRKKHGRGGTGVGVARARDLAGGKALPLATVKRMASYFARHEVDKQGKDWGNASAPSAGKIAHLLWGGEPGKRWANGIVKRASKETAGDLIMLELAVKKKGTRRTATKPPKKTTRATGRTTKAVKPVVKRASKKVATPPARNVKIWGADDFKWFVFRGKSAAKLTYRGKQYALAPGEKYGVTPEPDAKGNYRLTLASEGLSKVFAVLPKIQRGLMQRSNPVRASKVKTVAPPAVRGSKKAKVVEKPTKSPVNPDKQPKQVRVGADTPLMIKPQVASGRGWYRDVFWGDDYVGRLLYINQNMADKTSSRGGQVWFKLTGNADVNQGQRTEHVGLDTTDLMGPFKSVDDFGRRFAKLKPTAANIKQSGGGVVQIRGEAVSRSPISIDIGEAAICRALYEKEPGQAYLLSKSTYTRLLLAAEHHGLLDGAGKLTARGTALGKLCAGLPKGSVYTFASRYENALEKYLKLKVSGAEVSMVELAAAIETAANPANTEAQHRALHGHGAALRAAGYEHTAPGRWRNTTGRGAVAARKHLLRSGFDLHRHSSKHGRHTAHYKHRDGRKVALVHHVATNTSTFSQSR